MKKFSSNKLSKREQINISGGCPPFFYMGFCKFICNCGSGTARQASGASTYCLLNYPYSTSCGSGGGGGGDLWA